MDEMPPQRANEGQEQRSRSADARVGSLSADLRNALGDGLAMPEVRPELPRETLNALHDVRPLTVQLLHNRGISGAAVAPFLAGAWPATSDLPHLRRAVERLRTAVRAQEPIVVFGDYDADGMTSCALLLLALRTLGARATSYVPKYDDDGRGLNAEVVESLAEQGTRLIVTTDCGTVNVAEVELARARGMDVIVTDHHPALGEVAAAYALVNPQVGESAPADRALAGVGVAFRVAEALLTPTRKADSQGAVDTSTDATTDVESLLDLVAIGTIADLVPMAATNWALARAGLLRLRTAPRPGLRALIDRARLDASALSERDIAFAIAPHLNAAARLGVPDVAVALLTTTDTREAEQLAEQLDTLNQERQRQLDTLLSDARSQALTQRAGETPPAPVVIVRGDRWPLGLLGLVASRLVDEFGVPAIAVSREEALTRGSGRAPAGYDLGAALAEQSAVFRRFGGHARAAGFTVPNERLEPMLARLSATIAAGRALPAGGAAGETGRATVQVDCRLQLTRLISENIEAVRALEPFGPEFAEPVFIARQVRIVRCRRSGPDGRTLRLVFRDGSAERDALWPRRGALCDVLRPLLGTLPALDVIYTLGVDRRPGSGERIRVPRVLALAEA